MALSWYTAVTTAPRGVDYLPATLESLARAGWEHPHVHDDPSRKLGPWGNLLHAIKIGIETETDLIAVFQDDIEVTAGLRGWLDDGNLPISDGIVSLYCRWGMDVGIRGWRLFDFETITCPFGHRQTDPKLLGKDFRVCAAPGCKVQLEEPEVQCAGALGYVFRREVAIEFLRTLPNLSGKNQSDFKLAKWCRVRNKPLHYHVPSFIQHLGLCSATHGKNGDMPLNHQRVARRFARTATEIYNAPIDARYADIESRARVHVAK